jgi:choline-sulfatase
MKRGLYRPNILILMSDEHRADLAGFAGNSVVRTSVLDELARTGVVFRNAYTPSPICVPARQCIMAGQLTKSCGCDGAWMDLAPGYHTYARRFAQHAYHTVCAGKLHHIGVDQMQGWTQRLAPDTHVLDKYCDGLVAAELARYARPKLGGRKTNEDYVREACGTPGKYQRFDLRATEDAEDFVRGYFQGAAKANERRPVLLKLSLLQPHYPFFSDPELFRYYYDRVPIFREPPCDHPVLSQSQVEQPVNVTADEVRRATAAYYAMVETIDGHYGRLLQALRESGQDLDDWIVVYLSDHGEMLGEHGIWEKARFYEGSVRVPLIVRWPRRFAGGRVVPENVSLCDLFATLCDLAGIPCQPGVDSRSLVPLLEGCASGWSDEAVSQIRRRGQDHVMIKQGALKYQYYGEEIPEVLFDLAGDPGETRNLAGVPEHAAALRVLRARLAELGYGPDARGDYVNAGYEPGVALAPATRGTLWAADANPWLEQPRAVV